MSLAARNHQSDLTKKDRLNNEEAAKYLGLKAATLNKWRVYGEGPPFIKVGRLVRYRRVDLDAYLSGRLVQSTSEFSAR
ncbi:helix-turn-helix domain-containing protein [Hyphococcus flavus]|uniref:Helix-turn-helix domain-containing protein n=1 Tax=Hyphococcus flavus TaxID=1866326 RepID=A0AAE9ZBU9_9PROT|nr:helix-turn-helix domain-containing protein [Hyphococcus flavus]WDI31849.1 helix-turn-helix domain-containing protein [Hyphococcus flavus]